MKLKIKSKLKSNEEEYDVLCSGEIKEKIIKYMDNDILVEIDLINNKLKRISDTYELIFDFIKEVKTTSLLKLKDLEQTIEMDLYTIDIVSKDGYYYVHYELNNDELFEFELFYEED